MNIGAELRHILAISLKVGVSSLPLALALAQAPAHAQDAPQGATATQGSNQPADGAEADDARDAEQQASGLTGTSTSEEDSQEDDKVTVTGTLIRGIQPTGTNLITVTSEDIAATGASSGSGVLASVPQVQGNYFNGIPQVDTINSTAAGSLAQSGNKVVLRQEPGGTLDTGTSTLILVDGNRSASVSVNQQFSNPDAVPAALLERVEINLDGASSTYGSDAIAGVINFVTRRRFDGVEVSGRFGFADDYEQYDANAIVGKDWGTGSAYVSYGYSGNSKLFGRDRENVSINYATGLETGTTCAIPNAVITATPNRFYPAAGNGFGPVFTVNPVTGNPNVCTPADDATIAGANRRHNVLVNLAQDFGEDVQATIRGRYLKNHQTSTTAFPSFNAIINNTNPFFRPLTDNGVPLTSYRIQGSFGPSLGNINDAFTEAEQYGITAEIAWNVDDNWQLRLSGGWDRSNNFYENSSTGLITGQINTGFNTSPTSPCSVLATPAACLNPFDIGSSDPALLAAIADIRAMGEGTDEIWNARAVLDGALFELPGGKVRVALGAEYFHDTLTRRLFQGPRAGIEAVPFDEASHSDKAVFGEVNVPLVSSANAMSFVQELRLSASARYDHYSDFGSTFNPKFGASFKPVGWLRVRGTWGTSFRAPTLIDILGTRPSQTTVGAFPVSILNAFLPNLIDPSAPPTATQTTFLSLQGANPNIGPQTGENWSISADLTPMESLRISGTYYKITYSDTLQAPLFANFFDNPTLRDKVISAPIDVAECTAFVSQSANGNPALLCSDVDSIYEMVDVRTINLGKSVTDGIDYSIRYTREVGFGTVFASLAGTYILSNKSQSAPGGPFDDNLRGDFADLPRNRMTVQIGGQSGGFRAQATLNHTSGFDIRPTATQVGNQDHIDSFNVVNTFFSYDFPEDSGITDGFQVTLSINNIFDAEPDFRRTTTGQVDRNGNSIGRVIQFGLRKRF